MHVLLLLANSHAFRLRTHYFNRLLGGVGSGGRPAGRTIDVVGLRWPGRRTLVWRRSATRTVPSLLGSRTLPASICISTRAARDVAGSVAAGQSVGATSVATSATVD